MSDQEEEQKSSSPLKFNHHEFKQNEINSKHFETKSISEAVSK